MRRTLLLVITFATFSFCEPAGALEATDSMSSWKEASTAEKAGLVMKLLKASNSAAQARTIKCVDQAAAVPGHTDLRIAAIIKACLPSKDEGQPV